MGTRARHAPGTFAWVDLRTTDVADAKRFYAGLFGWSYTDSDNGRGGVYTAATLDGEAVAGLKPLADTRLARGVSPFWLNYVAVGDTDAAAARTRELGGTVSADPFDTAAGRMGVIADPTGATLCLWQSSTGLGACRVNDPGCLTWNELSTTDVPAASRFYAGLFDWRIEPSDTGVPSPYWTIGHDGAAGGRNGGMRAAAGTTSRWLPYFTVTSLDETLARVADGGGRRLHGPLDSFDGRIAILRDPQGAEFGAFAGRIDR